MPIPLIIFDVDNTLGHTSTKEETLFERFPVTVMGEKALFHMRPGLLNLLHYVFKRVQRREIRVGFWTAGTKDYAKQIITTLFEKAEIKNWRDKVSVFRTREETDFISGQYVKLLYELPCHFYDAALLIDDNPIHSMYNPSGKVLTIPAFDAHKKCTNDPTLFGIMGVIHGAWAPNPVPLK